MTGCDMIRRRMREAWCVGPSHLGCHRQQSRGRERECADEVRAEAHPAGGGDDGTEWEDKGGV